MSFLQNGNPFYPAQLAPMGRVGAASGSNAATAINIDDSTNVRTEKRLTWTIDEEKRLVSISEMDNNKLACSIEMTLEFQDTTNITSEM